MGVHSSKVAPQGGFEQGEASGAQRPEQEDWPQPESESRADPEAATGPQQLPASAGQPEQVLESSEGQEPDESQASGPSSDPPCQPSERGDSPVPEAQGQQPSPGRSRCQTNCLEQPLARGFQKMGLAVGSHPWLFLLAPLVLTAVLGTGLMYLPRETEENLEEHYTPLGSPAKAERRFVQAHFSTNEPHLFSPLRSSMEVNFASILVVSNTTNLLDQVIFSEISQLDKAVQMMTVPLGDGTQVLYPQVCARYQSTCMPSNPLLFTWQKNNNMDLKSITFAIYNTSAAPLYLAGLLGGTMLGPGSGISRLLLQAKAMRLQYYLKTADSVDSAHSQKWLLGFLDQIHAIEKRLTLKNIQVVYFTSLSRKLEFEATARSVVPLFYTAYLLIMLFAIVSCYRFSCIRNKMFIAVVGVISVALAVVLALMTCLS
ncbi:patched domain-containing protein 3-like [Talpa occidentalis]|uniref:patched domain-containing protein 3-like n=1 Tax=Talpa occidentalis TaxID=50954 RepID=UPI0023F969E6|nr:patched domain-containing protein 3-like [Talpa occidentalis]